MKKIQFLHSKLPNPPTAGTEMFRAPLGLIKKLEESDYSQIHMQELANLIGLYLDILRPIKITVGVESSSHMMMGPKDYGRLDRAGLYKIYGYDHSEIEITVKFRFRTPQVLAILVHESIHNYLYHHGVRLDDEKENEILTDIASAYLGFGHITYDGHYPIQWRDNEINLLGLYSSYTEHRATIGYVTSSVIFRAIIESVKLGRLAVKDVLSHFFLRDRLKIYFNLLPYIRKQRRLLKKEKLRKQILKKNNDVICEISDRIKHIYEEYKQVDTIFRNMLTNAKIFADNKEVGLRIREILYRLSTGEMENSIKFTMQKVDNMAITDTHIIDISPLRQSVDELYLIIEEWNKISSQVG